MVNSTKVRVALALALLGVISCADEQEDSQPCPCADGYVCCPSTNTCLREGAVCGASDGAPADAPLDLGMIETALPAADAADARPADLSPADTGDDGVINAAADGPADVALPPAMDASVPEAAADGPTEGPADGPVSGDALAGSLWEDCGGIGGMPYSLTFTPDGNLAILLSGSGLHIVEPRTGRLVRRHWLTSPAADRIRFAPKNDYVVTSTVAGVIAVRRAGDMGLVWSTRALNPAFSADGTKVAAVVKVGSRSQARVWRTSDGVVERDVAVAENDVIHVAFSPDGKLFATAAYDYSPRYLIKVWKTADYSPLSVTTPPLTNSYGEIARSPAQLEFSPDSSIIAARFHDDNRIFYWRPTTGARLDTFVRRSGSLAFTPDGKYGLLASASEDYNPGCGPGLFPLGAAAICGSAIVFQPLSTREASFSPDGALLAVFAPPVIGDPSVWNVPTIYEATSGQHVRDVKFVDHGHGQSLAFAFNEAKDAVVAIHADGWQRTWKLPAGDDLLTEHIVAAAFNLDRYAPPTAISPDASMVVVRKWPPLDLVAVRRSDGGELWRSPDTSGQGSLAFSPDGTLVVSSRYGGVRVFRASDGELLHELRGHAQRSTEATVSPDGTLVASAGEDKTVLLWRMSDGQIERSFSTEAGEAFSVTISPDNAHIAAASSEDQIRIWSLRDGTIVRRIVSPYVRRVRFGPDGTLLTAGWDGVKVWRVSDGRLLQTLEAFNSAPLAFSKDGSRLVTGGDAIRVWCRRP